MVDMWFTVYQEALRKHPFLEVELITINAFNSFKEWAFCF